LYRSACIVVIVLIFHLYWNCYCVLELLRCNSWYSGTVLVVYLLRGAMWGGSGLYSGFWVIEWVLYNCDLLWVSARVFLKHTVSFCVVSYSAVGTTMVYCELQWDVSGLYSGLCITVTCCGFQQGSSWNAQWTLCGFLVCCRFSSGCCEGSVVLPWANVVNLIVWSFLVKSLLCVRDWT